MQSNGLIDSAKFVKPVGTKRADKNAKINVREGSHGDRHRGRFV